MNWIEEWISPEVVTTIVSLPVEALDGDDAPLGPLTARRHFLPASLPFLDGTELHEAQLMANSAVLFSMRSMISHLGFNSISTANTRQMPHGWILEGRYDCDTVVLMTFLCFLLVFLPCSVGVVGRGVWDTPFRDCVFEYINLCLKSRL